MNDIIQAYGQVLMKENQAIDKLLALGEEKKNCIILGKVKDLDKMLSKEGIIAANLEKMENERIKIHAQIAAQWGMAVQELTAKTLVQLSQEKMLAGADLLKQQIEHMEKSIFQLQDINRQNNELIGASLEYIDSMQAMLIGDDAGIYSDKGTPASENTTRPAYRLIDKKA